MLIRVPNIKVTEIQSAGTVLTHADKWMDRHETGNKHFSLLYEHAYKGAKFLADVDFFSDKGSVTAAVLSDMVRGPLCTIPYR
jgi:hypothetical protein